MEGIRIDVSESITPEHLMSIEEGLNEFNGYDLPPGLDTTLT
jgi:hypothetical protein